MAFNTRNTHVYRQSRGATHGGHRVQPYENDYRQRRSQRFSGAEELHHIHSRRSSGSSSIQRPHKAYGVYRNPYLCIHTVQIDSNPRAVQSRPPTLLERLSLNPVQRQEDTESEIMSSRESSPAPTISSRTLETMDVELIPTPFEQEAQPDVEEGEIVDIPGFSMIAIKERELPQQLYLYTAMGALLSDWDDLLNDFECEYSRPLPSYAWE